MRRLKADRDLAYDDDDIADRAKAFANRCLTLSHAEALRFAASWGAVIPATRRTTARSIRRRLSSPHYWRRQLRKAIPRRAEDAARRGWRVHRRADPYTTRENLARHRRAKRRSAEYRDACALIAEETGELFPLADIAARSVSNPAIRRAEMIVRLKGFEGIARALGHRCLFFTLTAPSAFHVVTAAGQANDRYTSDSVRAAQGWLCKQWARARAKLKRLNVPVYGFRIAEPHHDGTPHWHMVLFVPDGYAATLATVIRLAWLAEHGDEPGAAQHRIKAETIDTERTDASGRRSGVVGYVIKYIAKLIDGHALVTDDPEETDLDGAEAAERVEAWARTFGIRQFQQIGGPSVTLWRELRRIREETDDEAIEAVRAAADRGDFAAFIAHCGGPEVGKRHAVRVWTREEWVECEDGGRTPAENEWGEWRGPRIAGVVHGITVIPTRVITWIRVVLATPILSELGPVAITVRGLLAPGATAAWCNPMESSRAGP